MASTSRSERDPDRPRKTASAAAPTAAPQGRSGKRMEEEDVGRPARSGRSGGGASRSGGMGLGARVGLITGLVTLLLMAAAVLPGLGGNENPDQGLNEAGAA